MCNRHYNKKTMYLILVAVLLLAAFWAAPKLYPALS